MIDLHEQPTDEFRAVEQPTAEFPPIMPDSRGSWVYEVFRGVFAFGMLGLFFYVIYLLQGPSSNTGMPNDDLGVLVFLVILGMILVVGFLAWIFLEMIGITFWRTSKKYGLLGNQGAPMSEIDPPFNRPDPMDTIYSCYPANQFAGWPRGYHRRGFRGVTG